MNFQGLNIFFSPSKDELKTAVKSAITDGVDAVCKYELFLNQPEFEVYTSAQEFDENLFDETNDLMALAIGSEFIFQETEKTGTQLDSVFAKVQEFAAGYTKFVEMYDENSKIDLEVFRENDPTYMSNALNKFYDQNEQIDNLEPKQKIKIVSLDA